MEFQEIPDVGDVPLIADMSSDILSRPLDVSRFGMIYAGAQKNIGASGLVVVIVRDDLLERCPDSIARIFNYAEHAAGHSLFNTPNTFGWYLASLVFKWLKREGGLVAMGERNRAKANRLYGDRRFRLLFQSGRPIGAIVDECAVLPSARRARSGLP